MAKKSTEKKSTKTTDYDPALDVCLLDVGSVKLSDKSALHVSVRSYNMGPATIKVRGLAESGRFFRFTGSLSAEAAAGLVPLLTTAAEKLAEVGAPVAPAKAKRQGRKAA